MLRAPLLVLASLCHLGGCSTTATTATTTPTTPADPWASVQVAEGAAHDAVAPPPFRNAAGQIACPVMGLAIASAADAVSYADHEGVRYYFCCDSCEKLFLEEPATYANGKYLAEHALDPTAAPSCSDAPPG